MIRVAFFPLNKELDYLADTNELIIDYKDRHMYIKDSIDILEYPSRSAIENIASDVLNDIKIQPGNMTGETYSTIYNNMTDVLNWIKSMSGDISNNVGVTNISQIMNILSGLEYGHDILLDINNKVDKVPGKILSEYNFDAYYKNKLDSMQYGANRYYHLEKQQCKYIPPVLSINGYYNDVNLTIRDIDGLGDVEEGANYYEHPKGAPVCRLEQFGVIAINGKSGNVNIGPDDIGMGNIKDYPIILTSTPEKDINLLSYASIQGAQKLIKNKFGHKNIIIPLENQDKVEVVFTTDNIVLMQDNTWYIELKDLRTEGALYDFTGRGFALDVDTSYIWRVKSNREDEVVSNKTGTLHVGYDDMIIKVGDGVKTIDRSVSLVIDNSDGHWTRVSHRIKRFNIYKSNGYSKLGTDPITVAVSSGGSYNTKLPDGKYVAELIYYDENNDLGRGIKDIEYQLDFFEVKYNTNNKITVNIKNQNYIPPNYANLDINLSVMLRKLKGGYTNINEDCIVEIRMRDGSYQSYDIMNKESNGVRYKANDLYGEAIDKIEGQVIYTDSEGNIYDTQKWEFPRSFTSNRQDYIIYITEYDVVKPYTNLMVLLENPITFDDMKLEVEVKDLSSGSIQTYESTNIITDNSTQHMDKYEVDDFLIFSFDNIIIDENKAYSGILYTGNNPITDKIILGTTTKNQFDFAPIRTSTYASREYGKRVNILNMGSPSLVSVNGSYDYEFNRYEDVRIYLRGSTNAIKNAKIQIKRSYWDELTKKTMFKEWEDITTSRSIKIYPSEIWNDGYRSPDDVQYSIRISGDNIRPQEVEDTVRVNSKGILKVYNMLAEMHQEPPKQPDPGESELSPNEASRVGIRVSPSVFLGSVAAIKRSNDLSNTWYLGSPISDNSDQHFFELNNRTSVNDYIDYEFNFYIKPQEMIDVAVIYKTDSNYEILKTVNRAIRGDHRGYPEEISSDISKINSNLFSINIFGVPHSDRVNDIRFVTKPPDAKIEYNLDSVWKPVSNRRLVLKRNNDIIPIRVSAYGYLTHEQNVKLWGASMPSGRVEVVKVDLKISPSNQPIYLQLIFPYCDTPTSNSNIEYRIFDQGKWKTFKSGDVFSTKGEGYRRIEIITAGVTSCLGDVKIFNVHYPTHYGPEVAGYDKSNPIVMRFPVTTSSRPKHGNHDIYK